MRVKKYLLICFTALMFSAFAIFLVACKGNVNSGSYKFEVYDYDPVDAEKGDWTEIDFPDADMTLDGDITADEYGKGYISFTDVNGVNMKVYAHMGEEGVFFGFVSNDHNVFYHEEAEVFNNTSVEIQVAPRNTVKLNANVVQLRLGANGYAEQWVGFKAQDTLYDYTRKYVPSTGKVKINGELNTSTCNGYSMELYLPYSSLNISGKPDSIVCAPSFNTKPSYSSGPRATWTMMLGCNLSEPASWYVVDDSGMTTFTSGYDESALETGDTITQTAPGEQFYYFGYDALEAFSLKATLDVVETGLADNGFPKFGLVSKSEESLVAFYIDAAGGTGNKFGKVMAEQATNSGTQWGWSTNSSHSMDGHWGDDYIRTGNSYNAVKLQMIYTDGTLYMLLDDVLVYTQHDYKGSTSGAIPGLMSFGSAINFKEIEVISEKSAVDELADSYIAKSVTIDGDLSDWENLPASQEGKFLEATDSNAGTSNGNTWKVRAFLGDDGLYIAYDVKHKVNPAHSPWDETAEGQDGWYRNTNIEFFINANHQYMLTTFGSCGYMDCVMKTAEVENAGSESYYQTYGEIFIPMENLAKDLRTASTDITALDIGFAFKTDDNMKVDANSGETMNGDNWWYFGGEPNEYFYNVTSEGIGTGEEVSITADYNIAIDGSLSDWPKDVAANTISVQGVTDSDRHKSAVFYGALTKNGVYVAADVYHDIYEASQSVWWYNSQFEIFIGQTSPLHCYVYATAPESSAQNGVIITNVGYAAEKDSEQVTVGMKAIWKTEILSDSSGAKYHTTVEAVIYFEEIEEYISGGAVRVGVAWKSKDSSGAAENAYDTITGGESSDGAANKYWVPAGAWTDNVDMPYVTQTGIYLRNEYTFSN